MKIDIEQKVTNKIIKLLESGNVAPWNTPWHGVKGENGFPLRANGEEYQGINVLLLWMERAEKGYISNQWMTFKQAKTLGGNVKKGEKSTTVVFFKPLVIKEKLENGDDVLKNIPILKTFNVFNLDQIENLPEKFNTVVEEDPDFEPLTGRIASADKYVENTGAIINHGGNQAFFAPAFDAIHLPEFKNFKTVEDYYSTLFHELIHWTNTKERLDRNFEGSKRFGQKGYATEELCAEIGACFLNAKLGIEKTVREDHASYIQSWLKALKNDKKFIFTASAKASQAVAFLDELQEIVEQEEKCAA